MTILPEELVKKHLNEGTLRESCSEITKIQCSTCGYTGESHGTSCPSCGNENSITNICLTCTSKIASSGSRECKSSQVFLETGKLSFPKNPGRATPLGEFVANLLIGLFLGLIFEILIRSLLSSGSVSINVFARACLFGATFLTYYLMFKAGGWQEKITGSIIPIVVGICMGILSEFIGFCLAFAVGYLIFSKSINIPYCSNLFEIKNPVFIDDVIAKKSKFLELIQKLKNNIYAAINKMTDTKPK